ncbi:TPA: sensor histidine kinase [Burkholderia cenocepacia]|uniref:sensor histidine kinase n=1 Tax=Burkholderia cenocepacia TaxID=95486 RepID=UPI001B98129C|nr:sensor histidine kinase [Burkholderia cenocepacia]MBR8140307.1 sensor histidine kinase [Burkholderia cenocepacia]
MTKLRPRARIIRTVGDQLISGPEAALIELVKNAFDADSPSVTIKICPPGKNYPTGFISVRDFGHGMPLSVIEGRWFEPATDEKQKQIYSPGRRRMLGAKGIGRFAVSRLGSHTVLESVALNENGEKEHVLVEVDWNIFTADKYLEEIDIPVVVQSLTSDDKTETGVTLEITEIRDVWTRKRLEALVRELRRVAVPGERENRFDIYLDLTNFKKDSDGFDGSEILHELNYVESESGDDDACRIRPFELSDAADYKLIGRFDEAGAFEGSFTICKGDNKPIPLEVTGPKLSEEEEPCGAFDLTINIYDRESESIESLFERMGINFSKVGIRAARKILTDNSGISIFRNGFRIRPYGEPENDWLELERQRVQNPSKKLGISQVAGRISIGSDGATGLIERSSREGLEHNGAFERLKRLVSEILTYAEDRRLDFRERAGLSRKPTADVRHAKSLANLESVTKAVASLPANLRERVQKAIERDSNALTASLDEIDEYQKLLQSRAALGLVVAQVIHEGRRILNPLATAGKSLVDNLPWVMEDSKKGELIRKQFPKQANLVNEGVKGLSRLFKRLDPVSGRRRGKPGDFFVESVTQSSIELFADALTDAKISIEKDISGSLRAHGYVEDFQAACLNVLENAVHWITTIDCDNPIIRFVAREDGKFIKVSISNNGPVIDESYVPRLFQAGASLKSDGTGLGLAIAREACRASKGDLFFDDSKIETTFVIEFPKA